MGAQAQKTWLTVVGIGDDGVTGLGAAAQKAISSASFVFGGVRHLELAARLIAGEAMPWPTPFSVDTVVALRGEAVCVLASGDPFSYGVGATLARYIAADEMHVLPAPSAFSLAASRLGWALQEIDVISLHGRSVDLIRPLLHRKRRIVALTSDEKAPAAIADLLTATGFGRSRLIVLEALGGEQERRRIATADSFDIEDINPLNVLAIEVVSDSSARTLQLASGLPDSLFEHDGQMTKREIRAVTMSSLAPRRGELLWDIGAGSGSVGIEWMLADPSMRAIAIEADPVRAERARKNAAACGIPGLQVIEGSAPGALAGLQAPDAIFVGGGGSDSGVMEAAVTALESGGRLVANAVTLEMEAVLLACHAKNGGELTRIAVSRAEPVGSMLGWRPAMPVTQWAWVKP
jgi:precorrin-6Y C5,15-methyltransferase (decarboxylating)